MLQRVKSCSNICTLANNLPVSDKNALSVPCFFGHIRNSFSDRKNVTQFGRNVRKGKLVNTVVTSFNTITGQMTEMS